MLTLRGRPEPRRGCSLTEVNAITDGAALIRDGIIVEVGPSRRLENLAEARLAVEIDASGRVVMPGFIDSHTHLAFPSSPDSQDEATRRVRACTGQRIEARTRTHLEAMARHGTTTVEAKTGCIGDESAESKLLRVLNALCGDPLDVVPSFFCRPPHDDAPATEWILAELLPKIHKRKIAPFADIACTGEGGLTPFYDHYLNAAHEIGFACRVHADSPHPADAVDLAVRHAVAGIDHLEHASAEDARRIGEARLMTTLLPISSLPFGRALPPARALIDAGAGVSIATDFDPHHSPTLNMQTAIALACLYLGMTIEEAISAATINAAHAVGRATRIGSIEPGKLADIVVLNIADYRDLRNSLGTNVVHLTIKNGRVIYQEGEVASRLVPIERLSA